MIDAEKKFDTVDLPDIPLPMEAAIELTADKFDSAAKFAIVGAGQGGSRIAETFWNLGYRRVCIINTSEQDMTAINISNDRKLLISGGGAGKDIDLAARLAKDRYEDILDFMRKSFGEVYDRILICAGSGGGTGAGLLETLVDVAHSLNTSLGIEENKVGVLIALPTNAEGYKVATNSLRTIEAVYKLIADKSISPLIILDNQRIKDIYPKVSVSEFWGLANKSICSLFHLFNIIACKTSSYASFDIKDYESILNSGVITFGAMPIRNLENVATSISFVIRDNLRRNVLADLDLHQGNIAGCIVIAGLKILETVSQEDLEHGYEQLSRILAAGSIVHRGIYQGEIKGLNIYTTVGGLGQPINRINELKNIAK